MGKGQRVSRVYMGIREGEPWPITVMKVGIGRRRREEMVTEELRVRRNSWQFYEGCQLVHGVVLSEGNK